MKTEGLLDRLEKSRADRKLLAEVEESEKSEATYKSAGIEYKELCRTMPGRIQEMQTALDRAIDEVKQAREVLRLKNEASSEAFRTLDSGLFQMRQREIELHEILYRNAPSELITQLADLRGWLQDLLEERPDMAHSTDLRKMKVYVDRSAVEANLKKRAEINAAIEEVERKILGGPE
jgi:hypothetical protein